MKNRSKKIIVIILITIVLVALGVALPIIVKGDNNTAQTSQVLSGKTFSTGSVVGLTGAMQNFAGQIPEVTATVEAADEDYIATIDLDDGYYESVKINAKPIYDAGVAEGTASLTGGNAGTSHILKDKTAYVGGQLVTGTMATLSSSNFSGTHSGTTAGASSTYTVKSSSAGYVAKDTTVNTLTAGTSPTIATTSATGTKTINIVPGYYNKISVNQTNAYNAGVSAGTSSLTGGNATAAQILKDKTAYVNGALVTGTMATLSSSNFSGAHSSTTAGAASNYTVKSSSAGYVAKNTTVNTLAATTSPTIATTSATGTQTINVKPGYYNKISVNQTNAYNKGKTDGRGDYTSQTLTFTVPANGDRWEKLTANCSFSNKIIGIQSYDNSSKPWNTVQQIYFSGNTVTCVVDACEHDYSWTFKVVCIGY